MGAGLTWKSKHNYTCNSVAPSHHNLPASHYILIPDHFIKMLISEKVRNSIEDSNKAPYGTHLSISNITSQWEMLQNPRGCDTLSGCRGERDGGAGAA